MRIQNRFKSQFVELSNVKARRTTRQLAMISEFHKANNPLEWFVGLEVQEIQVIVHVAIYEFYLVPGDEESQLPVETSSIPRLRSGQFTDIYLALYVSHVHV